LLTVKALTSRATSLAVDYISEITVELLLSPPLNTYGGSNIRHRLMPRITLFKARNLAFTAFPIG
jgi:hypothetical protein